MSTHHHHAAVRALAALINEWAHTHPEDTKQTSGTRRKHRDKPARPDITPGEENPTNQAA